MFLSAAHRSDYLGAKALLPSLPLTKTLVADRGYDADWFRWPLADRGIPRASHPAEGARIRSFMTRPSTAIGTGLENKFPRLKDWRRVDTRYDRCTRVLLSACALAAVVLFWL